MSEPGTTAADDDGGGDSGCCLTTGGRSRDRSTRRKIIKSGFAAYVILSFVISFFCMFMLAIDKFYPTDDENEQNTFYASMLSFIIGKWTGIVVTKLLADAGSSSGLRGVLLRNPVQIIQPSLPQAPESSGSRYPQSPSLRLMLVTDRETETPEASP
jgi:hypothetical protein